MSGHQVADVFIWSDMRIIRYSWQPKITSGHGEPRSLLLAWNPRSESESQSMKGIHEMSRKKVIQEIVLRHNAKLPLTVDVVQTEANELYQQACDQFGTWETALQYAGINVRRIRNIKQAGTRMELKQAIDDLPHEIRMISTTVIIKQYRRLYNAAIEHYGSWSEAVKAAGYDRPPITTSKNASPPEVNAELPPDAPQTSPLSADSSDRC
jgi:hypothetical protein